MAAVDELLFIPDCLFAADLERLHSFALNLEPNWNRVSHERNLTFSIKHVPLH